MSQLRAREFRTGERGAALILEIIIYLVIVALIAVAVISGVKAMKDLTFTMHAKNDVKTIQQYLEGKYAQDGVYPVNLVGSPRLTEADGVTNWAVVSTTNGSQAGYCLTVFSAPMSTHSKQRFWLTSARPDSIDQSGTKTNGGVIPDSGIPGVTCQG